MSSKVNKANAKRMVEEVVNGKKLEVIDELIAPNYVLHAVDNKDITGPEEVKQYFSSIHKAFPDFHMKLEDAVAEGDEVCSRFSAHCTHKGEYMGIPPTGKEIDFRMINIARFKDGKQVEVWQSYDTLNTMQQMGVAPPMAQAVR